MDGEQNKKGPFSRVAELIVTPFNFYLPIVTLISYALGLIYIYLYYRKFKISIVRYIGLYDLVYESLILIVPIIAVFVIIECLMWSLSVIIDLLVNRLSSPPKWITSINDNFEGSSFRFFTGLVFLYQIYCEFTGPFIPNLLLIVSVIFSIRAFIFFISFEMENKMRLVILAFLIGFLLNSVAVFVNNKVYNLMTESSEAEFSFEENGNIYSSKNDSYKVIGETFDYLFIFESSTYESIIFKKENIRNYRISNVDELQNLRQYKSDLLKRKKDNED